jgi:hypothetical protein
MKKPSLLVEYGNQYLMHEAVDCARWGMLGEIVLNIEVAQEVCMSIA